MPIARNATAPNRLTPGAARPAECMWRSVLLHIGPVCSSTQAMRETPSGWLRASMFIENRPNFIGSDTPDPLRSRGSLAGLVLHYSVTTAEPQVGRPTSG